jgi:hypothetical protein
MKKLNNYDWLYKQYHTKNRSDASIAEELGTYSQRVRRARIKLGIKSKSNSEAQKDALKTGRRTHPMQGKQHSEETKIQISESVSQSWSDMDEADLEQRKQKARDNWNNMPNEQREALLAAANRGNRQTAKEGSKLEKFLRDSLISEGFVIEWHKERLIPNHRLQVDLFMPGLSTAIEVDGPAHFLPIWGEENLARNMRSDSEKNGLLNFAGIKVIRVRHMKREVSGKVMRDVWNEVREAVLGIQNGSVTDMKIEIEVN